MLLAPVVCIRTADHPHRAAEGQRMQKAARAAAAEEQIEDAGDSPHYARAKGEAQHLLCLSPSAVPALVGAAVLLCGLLEAEKVHSDSECVEIRLTAFK